MRKGTVKESEPWKGFVLFCMYIFLKLGSWSQSNKPCKYEKPSRTISTEHLSLYFVIIRCFFLILLVVYLQTRQSPGVKENIKKTPAVYVMTETFQSDNVKKFEGQWSDSAEWKRYKWFNLDHAFRGRKKKWSNLIVSWEIKYPLMCYTITVWY